MCHTWPKYFVRAVFNIIPFLLTILNNMRKDTLRLIYSSHSLNEYIPENPVYEVHKDKIFKCGSTYERNRNFPLLFLLGEPQTRLVLVRLGRAEWSKSIRCCHLRVCWKHGCWLHVCREWVGGVCRQHWSCTGVVCRWGQCPACSKGSHLVTGWQVGGLGGGHIHSRAAVQLRLVVQGLASCCKGMLWGEATGSSRVCQGLGG